MQFQTMAEVRAIHKALGGHFFDGDVERHWSRQYHTGLLHGVYFITSEEYAFFDWERMYSVREVAEDGSIQMALGGRRFDSVADAVRAVEEEADFQRRMTDHVEMARREQEHERDEAFAELEYRYG